MHLFATSTAEQVLGSALTTARPGRGSSRGTELTDRGRQVLERLLSVRARVDEAIGPTGPTPAEIAAREPQRRRMRRRRGAR